MGSEMCIRDRYQIDIETGGDRIGDQRSIIEEAEEEAEVFRTELQVPQSAHEDVQGTLDNASQSLEEAKATLKSASA